MSQVPLAPPPPTGGPIDGWLYLLWKRVTAAGQILWSSITPSTSADVAAVVTDETGSPGSLVFSGNPTLAGITNSGNLVFTGTANRITGDFSNSTSANRVLFQTTTTNTQTAIGVIPNGSATQGTLIAYNNADPDNAAYVVFLCNATESSFRTSYAGTAGFLPMTFHIGGAEKARIATDGTFTAGGVNTASALKVTPVASQARWVEVTGATSSGNPKLNTSAGSLELGSTGSTAITINSSGNVGIGAAPISTVPLLIYHATTANLTVQGDASTVLQFQRFSNDATSAAINFKKARGTTASQSAVASGDELGIINFSGWGGSSLAQGVYIRAFVDTYVSTSDVSTYLTFSTRAAATGAPVEALRITSAQRVVAANTIATAGYTVATLPAGTVGDRAYVTDALAPAYGVAVAGGGAVTVPVFYNGAAWICA